ncbi:hypothetical protein, variant 1 [Aphanomyces invadans]|uniref:HECT domain-containing protein n=1 Tax=Aphanomyces invadans TaxID=157072 RepID=A0A024UG60_9STRA|nr:hypothetical protein, variant 1 [Aphanomyces invadans]ETW05376.1 hypothetical protein, variant 1 [Aphanomyces invadans]|eukprot:XP_008866813.1 hypothetical protein, variant 1 [Aphanomyces invadans]
MDDIIPVYVGIAAGVGIVLLCMCSRMTRNTWHIDTALVEAFLAEDNLHHLEHTLQRHDIEELLREVERWECSVCGFLNVVPQPACSLCHTKHGVKLIEPFQHDVVQSHLGTNSSYVGSALFKYSALSSSLHAAWASPITSVRGVKSSMQRATISSTSGKVSSLKRMTASRILHWTSLLHHALLPEDLNHHQRSARMRRQWRRKMDPRNYQVVWVRQFTDHDDFSVAYVIQLNPPDSVKGCFEIDVADTRVDFELHAIVSSNVGDASSPPRDTDDQKIAWTPLELVDGNYTVMGTKLADPLWRALLSVSEMKFTCKYAWFLEQAASLVVPYEVKHSLFRTPRSAVLEEAVRRLNHMHSTSLCAILRIHFTGESGHDAGAVLREW